MKYAPLMLLPFFGFGCASTDVPEPKTAPNASIYYVPPPSPEVSYRTVISSATVDARTRSASASARHAPAWDEVYPSAAKDLDAWASQFPDAAKELLDWNARDSDRARQLFGWSASTQYIPVADFVLSRGSWTELNAITDSHRPALEALVAWCRHYQEAALALSDQVTGLARLERIDLASKAHASGNPNHP